MPAPVKPAFIRVTDPHNCRVEFVSLLTAGGHTNGVVNLTFATARHTPNEKGEVDSDFVVSSRLRMDLACATQLRGELDRILGQAQAQLNSVLGTALASAAVTGTGISGKSN